MESVGFKEWALVCEALGRGEQNIILRKGGIAEGREGFAFRHAEFFLFPTFFHEQAERLRGVPREIPPQPADEIEIRFFARVETASVITSWDTALGLEPFHVLKREVVRERFDYDDEPGIHVAFLRVFRLEPGWKFADDPRYGGCRSWVQLPPSADGVMLEPAVTDAEHQARRELFSGEIERLRNKT